jgi:hypothetical protein
VGRTSPAGAIIGRRALRVPVSATNKSIIHLILPWNEPLTITVKMATVTSIPQKVLVFGATGLIGQHIIREIYHARSSFEKIGIFTSESTAKNKKEEINEWKKKGVEVIVGDVSSEDDISRPYEGAHRNNSPTFGITNVR